MVIIRWLLGIIIVFLGAGLVILFIVGNSFRQSFGASEDNPLFAVLLLVAFAILLAGVIFPAQKALLHVGALAALVLVGFCIWMLYYESATVMWFGLIYLAVWLFYYWWTVFGSAR